MDGQAAAGSDADAVVGAAASSASGHETYVQVERLQQGLCGRSRPHFFRGVATVRLVASQSRLQLWRPSELRDNVLLLLPIALRPQQVQ